MVSVPNLKRRIDERLTSAVSAYVDGTANAHVGLLNARERTRDGDDDNAIQYPYVGYEGFTRPDESGLGESHRLFTTTTKDDETTFTQTQTWAYTLRLDIGVFATSPITRDELTAVVRDEMLQYVSDASALHTDVTDVAEVNVASDDAVARNVVGLRDTYEIDFHRTRDTSVDAITDIEVTFGTTDTKPKTRQL